MRKGRKNRFRQMIAEALTAVLMLLTCFPAGAHTAVSEKILNVHTAAAMGTEEEDPWSSGDFCDEAGSWDVAETEEVLLGKQVDTVNTSAFDYTKNGTYGEMLMEAARVTGMSPFVMTAMILQEMGKEGNSPLVTGEGINGEYKGIYNFINYQAYAAGSMTARERGLWWADGIGATSYGRPWNSPERSIFRGMGIMAANYVLKGQDTYYFKKFNTNPKSWKGDPEHDKSPLWDKKNGAFYPTHQYMSNVEAAKSEGTILGNFYKQSGIEGEELTFLIPIYENMPADPSPEPGKETKAVPHYSCVCTDSVAERIISDFADAPGYADLILPLHEKHPSWNFLPVSVPASYDGVDTTWDAIITGEMADGMNLANSAYHGAAYIRGSTPRDSGGWVDASREAVAYFMDPRNFLTDTSAVYQFVTHGYDPETDTYVTMDNLKKMMEGSFLAGEVKRAKSSEEKKQEEKSSDGGSSGGSGSSGGGFSGGGGSSGGPITKATSGGATFSDKWYADAAGTWRIKDSRGNVVKSAWLCDDAVAKNGQNVWYLLNTDGTMLAAGLVQDNTGNYYSLETNHNGYFGMLRYVNGTYDGIYMEFSQNHDGTFGAIKNQSAIDALKAKYGVTKFGIGNENCVYSKTM